MARKSSIGEKLSDKLSNYLETWNFLFWYTVVTGFWLVGHSIGLLHIDNPDFAKYNLFLNYFSGAQASIVLMATSRRSAKEKTKEQKEINKIIKMLEKIDNLEEIIEEMSKEKNNKED